ncbi:type II toxin-antitoxin system VapB family antitoxin [Enterovirga rhinocerotis]|uniref:Antitoxin VapB n=1 Tax=Enterovirga rhinocerotis TaxID=1339210 RepID=A0A4R7BNW0_9HYPH|nr:type II toxin-antitoxin system VapB family antitoxin [Enterovirga rhinocerotis]TDR87214.1 antitoxin VapB [Enterovirga rhinocerotis]
MGLSIKNEAVEALARDLARRHGTGVTEIIRRALQEMADREAAEPSLWEKLAPLRERLEKMGRTGLPADRAFYDELSGES